MQPLSTLDASKIKRMIVTRRKNAIRVMKQKAEIDHFIRYHASDEVEQQDDGRFRSVRAGTDYQEIVLDVMVKPSPQVAS